ncbi:hypothetical protein MUK42_09129 [Musa troglodytarum]|uniref:EGF-like domain-containing protein n=1 Tax=Musa troglodytarum TaxID=320322 RepID=A0A9E7E857_9LILI|nr:hypothetical protein MUK42_09129 [Musa troglodytarum]
MLPLVGAAASAAAPLPGCRTRCGEVDVPYPFGIGPNCSREGFSLDCNTTDDGLEKLFVFNVEITNISLPQGQARMLNEISWQCYNVSTNSIESSLWSLNLTNTPYRFSDDLNKFTVIGCDTLAYIGDFQRADSYQSGCVSVCHNEVSLVNSSCSGIGCCQTSIPKDLAYYEVWFDSNFNSSSIWNFSRCSYAVLLEANQFEFLTSYITTTQFWYNNDGTAPLVVDWAIGNETCEVAQRDKTSYACISEHSECLNSSNGPGYLCNCSSGYHGNPYVAHGCQDIDECSDNHRYPCHGICQNLPGSYKCFCPPGTYGDARNGTCTQQQKLQSSAKMAIVCKSRDGCDVRVSLVPAVDAAASGRSGICSSPTAWLPNEMRRGFSLDCNTTTGGHEKLFVFNVEIVNISLPLGQARMLNEISWQCYNVSTNSSNSSEWSLNFVDTPYRFSDVHNKFTVIGCDALAYIGGWERHGGFWSGCVSVCYNEANRFEFLTSYITTTQFRYNNNGTAPLVVDWAIRNETCEVAQRNKTSYACISEHSECLNSSNGPGYLCNCSRGYHGNPYVAQGCQDIDECSDKDQYPCHGICQNLPGSHNCFCPVGLYGDAVNGTCTQTQHQKLPSSAKVAIGIIVA